MFELSLNTLLNSLTIFGVTYLVLYAGHRILKFYRQSYYTALAFEVDSVHMVLTNEELVQFKNATGFDSTSYHTAGGEIMQITLGHPDPQWDHRQFILTPCGLKGTEWTLELELVDMGD